jgi:hypothetical protein
MVSSNAHMDAHTTIKKRRRAILVTLYNLQTAIAKKTESIRKALATGSEPESEYEDVLLTTNTDNAIFLLTSAHAPVTFQ